MNDALYVAATGMKAQHAQLEVIANNVANVNTPAFKRASVRFSDLVSQSPTGPEAAALPERTLQTLAGVGVAGVQRQFSPAELRRTGDPMSLAVQGEGFIEVLQADGTTAYLRGATLQINGDRLLASADGHVLRQRIHVPQDATGVSIAADGQVSARDDKGREWGLGRLELALFSNPGALAPLGENLFRATPSAGEPLILPPSEGGAGRLMQGYQEASNVKLVDEMVQLMVAQRAYEMSVKVVQAADEMAGLTNNLRK